MHTLLPRCVRLLPLVLVATALAASPTALHAQAPPAGTVGKAAVQAAPEPKFDGLGKHTRKITTSNPEAQRYFDQGLNFLFAFNHAEAIRSFQAAAATDPNCAMAYWGVAVANGPNINFPLVLPDSAKEAWAAVTRAKELSGSGTDVEKALIEAQAKRYADPQPDDRRPLDEAYAAAMRDVYKRFPEDDDAGVLFAEALMDLRPWDLWDVDGTPRPETPEVLSTLEAVLKRAPDHPQALHLYIHAVEASPEPAKGIQASDRLRNLTPGLGHLVHMPSHIDVRTGRWQQAVETNQQAIDVDRRYAAKAPRPPGFYRVYMAHNRHMLAFASLMQGQSRQSLDAIRSALAAIPDDFKKENAALIDGFFSMPYEVMTRFGKWDDVLAEPEPPEYFPISRALRHAARGVAQAALGRVSDARASQSSFRAGVAATPKDATFGNNTAAGLFAVADAMLDGEILLKEGKRPEGLAALREAVAKEDQLRYDEPPDWIQPVRHALGAALLQSGGASDAVEAEQVYRADLKRWPENGWSLYGLSRSLEAQGKKEEAKTIRARFDKVWSRADVTLTSSCFCQPGALPTTR